MTFHFGAPGRWFSKSSARIEPAATSAQAATVKAIKILLVFIFFPFTVLRVIGGKCSAPVIGIECYSIITVRRPKRRRVSRRLSKSEAGGGDYSAGGPPSLASVAVRLKETSQGKTGRTLRVDPGDSGTVKPETCGHAAAGLTYRTNFQSGAPPT